MLTVKPLVTPSVPPSLQVLLHQLPAVAPLLQAGCLTELAAADRRPAKLTRPLLQLLGKLVTSLKSHQEVCAFCNSVHVIQSQLPCQLQFNLVLDVLLVLLNSIAT